MKNRLKKFLAASFLSIVAGFANMAFADALTNGSLGDTVGAIDYYQVSCSSLNSLPTKRLDIQVRDKTAGSRTLSLNVLKGLVARNATDPVGGDAGYSQWLYVFGGNGIYHVLVSKTTAAARIYDINFHCMNGATHTVTSISKKQDN